MSKNKKSRKKSKNTNKNISKKKVKKVQENKEVNKDAKTKEVKKESKEIEKNQKSNENTKKEKIEIKIEEKKIEEKVTEKIKNKYINKIISNKSIIRKIISIVALIVFLLTTGYLIYYYFSKEKEIENIEEIQEYFPEIEVDENNLKTELMLKVEELKGINEDIRGWIILEDSPINYPILQGTDNEYYLKHDYKKESNKHGSIYLKNGCDINDVNSNLIIYGHNLKDDEMFNNILKYADKSYYEKHKIFKITTENEEREYEVISAFKSRIFYEKEENVFRYYNYLNFNNEAEYNSYLDNVRKIQLYDTGIQASYGEQLATFITCEYSIDNGRMVVVAKRIK